MPDAREGTHVSIVPLLYVTNSCPMKFNMWMTSVGGSVANVVRRYANSEVIDWSWDMNFIERESCTICKTAEVFELSCTHMGWRNVQRSDSCALEEHYTWFQFLTHCLSVVCTVTTWWIQKTAEDRSALLFHLVTLKTDTYVSCSTREMIEFSFS